MGSVAVTEQAIVNEAHNPGPRCPNRSKRDDENTQVPFGAYVAFPKKDYTNGLSRNGFEQSYPCDSVH